MILRLDSLPEKNIWRAFGVLPAVVILWNGMRRHPSDYNFGLNGVPPGMYSFESCGGEFSQIIQIDGLLTHAQGNTGTH